MLNELFGMSASEFTQKKKLLKKDSQSEQSLREVLRQTEYKIEKLDVLADIEFSSQHNSKIINIIELKDSEKQMIDEYVMARNR